MALSDKGVNAARARAEATPDEPAPWFALCRVLLERGDPGVLAHLPQLERFPFFAAGWCDLGMSLLAAGQAGAALVAFDRALASDAVLLPALLGRSAVLLALGRGEEALKAAGGVERAFPRSAAAAFRHGLALRAAGRMAAAEAAFGRALTLDPRHAEAAFHLGSLRGDRGDHTGAAAALRASLAVRPDLHEAAFNLGVALTELRALDAALDAFAHAWRLRPASFGRIAQALVSVPCGCLFLDPAALRRALADRAA